MSDFQNQNFEKIFKEDLYGYLLSIRYIDRHFPEAPDLEELWPQIVQSYMSDGVREYNSGYPSVAFGWIMFVGMAVAKYWDVEWGIYGKVPDLYGYLRDSIDYDHLDDYVLDKVLCLESGQREVINEIVAECASRTFNKLSHLNVEPCSPNAFKAFAAALHQMYLAGIAMELKLLGYHMTKIN